MSNSHKHPAVKNVFFGNCLICGVPITNEEGKAVDCYNPECIEYRKNLVVPEGWTITPFERSFSCPGDGKTERPILEDQLKMSVYRNYVKSGAAFRAGGDE